MSHWTREISRAIHEGRWVSIVYQNSKSDETKFWVAFKDIDPQTMKCNVDIFNSNKTPDFVSNYTINFNNIKHAICIENSFTTVTKALSNKIKNSIKDFLFLEFQSKYNKILSYYNACYRIDSQPYENQISLIESIDLDSFHENSFTLDEDFFDEAIKLLQRQLGFKVNKNSIYEQLVINVLSIHSAKKGIIPIAYYSVLLDIENRSFKKSDELSINNQFIHPKDENSIDLNNYFDVDFTFVKENYLTHKNEFIEQLKNNISFDEKIDEMPYFMKLVNKYSMSLAHEYESIQKKYENNELTYGLRSFFGLSTKADRRHGLRKIVIGSKKINTNQLRIVHHATNYNVTYVQGPPGSGKSVSIENILHSALHNNDTVCVTSNNNEAVNHIVDNLGKIKIDGVQVRYPFLRLGNDSYIREAIEEISSRYYYYNERKDKKEHQERFKEARAKTSSTMSDVSVMVSQYEQRLELLDEIKTIEDLIKATKQMEISNEIKAAAIIDYEAQIEATTKKLPDIGDDIDFNVLNFDELEMKEYLKLMSDEFGFNLLKPKNKSLIEIIEIDSKKERLIQFKNFIKTEEGFISLINCFPIIFSTNISLVKLGTPNSLFELAVIEEASQSSAAVSLIPLNRAKRLCIVGDPNQLQPVVNITEEKNQQLMDEYNISSKYNYRTKSIFNTMIEVDLVSKFIFLDKHYRCHKKIATFSNKKYYNDKLDIQTDYKNPTPLKLINIQNSVASAKNTSHSDIEVILEEIKITPKDKEVAVITPFKNQARQIQVRLEEEKIENVKVGTIHTFQGQEKDKIILSSAITSTTTMGAFDFVKNNRELINVATTRPREELVVIADVAQISRLSGSEMNDYYELITYIMNNGESEVKYQGLDLFESRAKNVKIYNTHSESEFLRTLAHIKSSIQKFTFADKSKVSDVLNTEYLKKVDYELFKYSQWAHFDFIIFDHNKFPLVIFEICGDEHFNDPARVAKDKMKLELCERHNIKLIFIQNEDVRRYIEIKKLLISKLLT